MSGGCSAAADPMNGGVGCTAGDATGLPGVSFGDVRRREKSSCGKRRAESGSGGGGGWWLDATKALSSGGDVVVSHDWAEWELRLARLTGRMTSERGVIDVLWRLKFEIFWQVVEADGGAVTSFTSSSVPLKAQSPAPKLEPFSFWRDASSPTCI